MRFCSRSSPSKAIKGQRRSWKAIAELEIVGDGTHLLEEEAEEGA